MIGIVYVITNTANGKRYVGQTTTSLRARWRAHCAAAFSDKPLCRVLYAAIRKYGYAAFSAQAMVTLCDTTQEALDLAEGSAIVALGTLVPNGYNLRAGGGRGLMHAETKAKMSVAHKGRPHSPEHAANISRALTGRRYSRDRIAKMRAGKMAGQGWIVSAETRLKLSVASRGRPQHPNQIAALRAAHFGAKRSPETCARISAALKASRAAKQQQALELDT